VVTGHLGGPIFFKFFKICPLFGVQGGGGNFVQRSKDGKHFLTLFPRQGPPVGLWFKGGEGAWGFYFIKDPGDGQKAIGFSEGAEKKKKACTPTSWVGVGVGCKSLFFVRPQPGAPGRRVFLVFLLVFFWGGGGAPFCKDFYFFPPRMAHSGRIWGPGCGGNFFPRPGKRGSKAEISAGTGRGEKCPVIVVPIPKKKASGEGAPGTERALRPVCCPGGGCPSGGPQPGLGTKTPVFFGRGDMPHKKKKKKNTRVFGSYPPPPRRGRAPRAG